MLYRPSPAQSKTGKYFSHGCRLTKISQEIVLLINWQNLEQILQLRTYYRTQTFRLPQSDWALLSNTHGGSRISCLLDTNKFNSQLFLNRVAVYYIIALTVLLVHKRKGSEFSVMLFQQGLRNCLPHYISVTCSSQEVTGIFGLHFFFFFMDS